MLFRASLAGFASVAGLCYRTVKAAMKWGLLGLIVGMPGCFSSIVNAPDGKSAFAVKCSQMKDCVEEARGRCQAKHDEALRNGQSHFLVWTGEVQQTKNRFVWTYDLVDGTGTWGAPPTYTVVTRDDPEEKKPPTEQMLVARCAD